MNVLVSVLWVLSAAASTVLLLVYWSRWKNQK